MDALRHFLLAVQFFTRIPMPAWLAAWVGFSPALQRASTAYWPAVGWVVGLLTGALYLGLMPWLPDAAATPWLLAVVSTAFTAWLTGGLHEDGLADLADGLGGSRDPARSLAIMKDSRVGASGVLALVLLLQAKVAALALLGDMAPELAAAALLAGHVVSRTLPLLLIRTLPYVGDAGHSKSVGQVGQISTPALLVATVWTLLALVGVAWWLPEVNWAWAVLAAALALVVVWRLLAVRLQGYTGDALGAAQQVCELAFYLGLALSLSWMQPV